MRYVNQLAGLSGVMAALVGATANAAIISYEGDALPQDSTPAWSVLYHSGGTTDVASGGILTTTVNAPGDDLAYRLFGAPDGWEPNASGSSVDVRLKVVSQAPGAGRAGDIFISTDTRAWLIRWGAVVLSEELDGGSFLMDTTDNFHDYRFAVSGSNGPLQLYVDGAALPAMSWNGINYGGGARIDFGDTHNGDGGTIQWDYVRLTSGEVPEPASLSLLALGALALRRTRRHSAR